ncbi:MAG TPA: ATP-dependent helicase, partial [Phormidium sp.]
MFVTSQNTNVKIITSSDSIPIDHHFKVIAGPGAGKTYWLVNHIKGVLRQSKKLTRSGKIACITYTNVASEEIVRRLGDCGNSVDASTIHSFLYRNVIKPYSFLLGAEGLFNPLELNGHDDHIPNMGLVSKWKSQTEQYYLKDDSAVCKCLSELDWFFDKSDTLKLKPRNPWRQKIGKYSIRNDSFIEYKKICWNKGFLHHEDVLYFSYNLISKNPRILEFIRVRFPYIFIDEFQDTHPIQAKIISLIGRESTLVGIIGDPCQSIYKFQGASRKHFLDFKLPGIQEYKIIINRRSAANIVNFLNHFRDQELIQEIHHIGEENSVIVFVGDPIEVVKN